MERIPWDVIINHIIPYTYNIQSTDLLEDIRNYYTVKKRLMENRYDMHIIKHEIFAVFYDSPTKLLTILHRRFSADRFSIISLYNRIYNMSSIQRFNILLGLFTKEERNCFLEYLFRDHGIWIQK